MLFHLGIKTVKTQMIPSFTETYKSFFPFVNKHEMQRYICRSFYTIVTYGKKVI